MTEPPTPVASVAPKAPVRAKLSDEPGKLFYKGELTEMGLNNI